MEIRKTVFYGKEGETLEGLSKEAVYAPSIRSVQGQVVWGSDQPDLVKDVPVHGRRLNYMIFEGPFHCKPWDGSMILSNLHKAQHFHFIFFLHFISQLPFLDQHSPSPVVPHRFLGWAAEKAVAFS